MPQPIRQDQIPHPAAAQESSAARDAALLRRMGAGDAAALRELYTLYAGPLYSYILRVLHSAEDAEDALQEIFVRMWKKAPDFDPARSSAFTWAWMLTRGHCFDILRRRGRRAILHSGPSLDDMHAAPVISISGTDLQRRDEIRRVISALEELPAPDRRALEMAVFLEYTGEEIAGELQQPLGTVKSRIRRGLQRLRQILQRHDR